MDFDLGKLTVVGWLVLLATFAIFLIGAFFVAMTPEGQDAIGASRGSRKLVGGALLGVAVVFFIACKYGLAKIGLPMFRS